MKKKKLAIILCVLVLCVTVAINGTISYLSATDSETNVFTLGEIDVDLTEPGWDPQEENVKTRYPGDTIEKDPTITATEGESYMRVKVELVEKGTATPVSAAAAALIWNTVYFDSALNVGTGYSLANLAASKQYNDLDYTLDAVNSTAAKRYYTYTEGGALPAVFSASDGGKVLFNRIVIPTDYTAANFTTMGDYDIIITVEAIQTNNITPQNAVAQLNAAF